MNIWSTELVVIEMLIGRPLWPGEDELEQLWMITGLLGPPPAELVAVGKRRDEFWDDDLRMKAKPGATTIEPGSMDLTKVLDKPDPHLVDFLTQCLTWDPADRILAATALQHPWIQSKEFSLPGSLKGSRLLPELMSGRKVYV
jgi:dual specificity tyrosine-phosphorylation-regulated kinase 2/3/4